MQRTHTIPASQTIPSFPPVVTVLGHVDHGKTTLLDTIRKTTIANREFGGITQKIGASSVEVMYDGKKRSITFIDTPGHEAFTAMRSRGIQAADIGILVVSTVDGVMPQTKESIALLQETKLPFIVALTKADLATKQTEKVRQQLLKEGVMLEGLGGDIPYLEVSATTGLHIKELLDLLILSFDMQIQHASFAVDAPLQAVVIESKIDSRTGPRATIVIKNGMMHVREQVVCEKVTFRIRTLITADNRQVQSASIGEAVEVVGMPVVLPVGSLVTHAINATEATQIQKTEPQQRALLYAVKKEDNGFPIILCADTEGSLEAILYALPKEVRVISKKTGEVSESDILLAKLTGAIVVSFNTRMRPEVQKLALTEKILAKNYQIIYEMIDEISDVVEGKKQARLEEIYGTARVQAKFPFEKTFVLGITVLDGRVARGDRVRIMRGEAVIGESIINSLRVGKNPQSKVEKGHEAGIILNTPLDFLPGDVLLSHN